MSEGLYDRDGIDGPFERRMAQAMREDDAQARKVQNRNPKLGVLMARLRAAWGGKCRDCGATESRIGDRVTPLEFAHLAETPVNGRGRGGRDRYFDIKRHPESYALLCRSCHAELDEFRP